MNEKQRQNEFLELFEPVRENLSRFARAMARNKEEAKDLVSEAIMLGFSNFHKLKSKEAFLSYMFTIIRRLHKTNNWKKRIFSEWDESAAQNLISNETTPEVRLDVEILYKALNVLPYKQKEAVVLFEISGLSIEEIRDIQKGTISGVKSRLKRGRERLSEIMNSTNSVNKKQIDENDLLKDRDFVNIDLLKINEQAILN